VKKVWAKAVRTKGKDKGAGKGKDDLKKPKEKVKEKGKGKVKTKAKDPIGIPMLTFHPTRLVKTRDHCGAPPGLYFPLLHPFVMWESGHCGAPPFHFFVFWFFTTYLPTHRVRGLDSPPFSRLCCLVLHILFSYPARYST